MEMGQGTDKDEKGKKGGCTMTMSCLRSCMRQCSQMASFAASVEDWEMLDCSLEDQEMGLPVSRKMAPDTEQHVTGSMA